MTTARICDRWDMELPEVDPNDQWFLGWAANAPSHVSTSSGWWAYNSLLSAYSPEDISSAREYFGGLGAQSLIINHLFHPQTHEVLEYSPGAVKHLNSVLPPRARAFLADSYKASFTEPADLVGLDFGDLTAWKTQNEKHGGLLDRVFLLEPKAVVITDVASRYLHLHRSRYETLLGEGTCGTYGDYLEAFSRLITERWGYSLVGGFRPPSGSGSSVMAVAPVGVAPIGTFQAAPVSPVGFQIL